MKDEMQATDLAEGFSIVGIGASAGGLESLERFFAQVPVDSGLAYVVIQHLSPDFKSMMDELLARHTDVPIRRADDNITVRPNNIYLLPPTKEMIVASGRLHLTDKDPDQGLTLPIDHFFRSLAHNSGASAVGVILSGTGSDGSRGIKDIHEAGGLVLCETESTAKFDGMPLSAQETGVVDVVLTPEQMPAAIMEYVKTTNRPTVAPAAVENESLEGAEAVFDLLRREYDIDFSHYKPTTVSRRIDRRLSLLHVRNLDDYVERLRQDEEELNALYRDLLIGVTKFFRDTDTFEFLERQVIPDLLQRVPPDEEIRAWVAGCATGEEAYSLAILIHEALEQARRPIHMKIFATDVHRASLDQAGRGIFEKEQLAEVSDRRMKRYFRSMQAFYEVAQDLRQQVVFAQHNVLKDAPFTKLDLISCRNLLIYFQPQAQKKALSLFHFGLKARGTLLLGSSETPGQLAAEFETIDQHCKVFSKRRDVRLPVELRLPLSRTTDGLRDSALPMQRMPTTSPDSNLIGVYDSLLDRFMPPSLLINEHREVVESFAGGQKLLHFKGRRPSHDLLDLLDTDARTSIAGALNRVVRHNRPLSFSSARLKYGNEEQSFRLDIEPIEDMKSAERHFLITLQRLDHAEAPQPPSLAEVDAAEMSKDQVQNLEEELRYTKENLQATIEELETSNEEMQATNQELVASNEELQSTNEELHSVNEELYTVNAEHQKKIEELAELNRDVEHLLSSSDVAIVFLDQSLHIRKFTPQVAEIFDLVDQDIGRRIGTFSHRIRHDGLIADLEAVLADGTRREKEVQDLDGRCYLMRILPYRIAEQTWGVVLCFIDVSVLYEARDQISHLSAIVESSEDAIIGVDLEGTIKSWNAGAERLYGYSAEQAIGRDVTMIVPDDQVEESNSWMNRVRGGEHMDIVEVNRCTKDGQGVHVSLSLSPIVDREGKIVGASSISRDVSQRKLADEARAYLSAIVASSDDAIIGKTLDGLITSWNQGAERLYGYTAQEMLGQPISKLAPPDRVHEIREILDKLRHGERVQHVETVRVRKDGKKLDVSLTVSPIHNPNGELVGGSAIARDITPLKRAHRDKATSERHIRLLLESTAEAITGLDEAGNCTFANPACAKLLGLDSADELLGANIHDLIHHSSDDGTAKRIDECPFCQSMIRGERWHCEEEIFFRKDGSSFFAEAWSHPMIDSDGEIIGVVVTFLDITDRKQAVENLRNEARRREQFLAMLSHELRNPLSAIQSATSVLNAPGIDTATDAESRRVINRQTSQMSRLLDDLLEVSRMTQNKISLNKKVIDLRSTIEDAVHSVRTLADHCEIQIDVEVPDHALMVRGDITRLEQIHANLLTNAIKYSPPGERVKLELACEGNTALISVEDNGAGIAPELLDSIFDMFVQANETLDRAQGGMGVGLTLVRKLVEMHDGAVHVHSDGLGRGSRFEVRLPLAQATDETSPPVQNPRSDRMVERVVLIEDQDDNRQMLSSLLELEGLKVWAAASGGEGLELIDRERPDAAIVDIGLPEIDGYEVARRVRNTVGDNITLIALTGYGQARDVESALEAGFDQHLVKPLQAERLSQALNLGTGAGESKKG